MNKYALIVAVAVSAVFLVQRLGSVGKQAPGRIDKTAPETPEVPGSTNQATLLQTPSSEARPNPGAVQAKDVGRVLNSYTLSLSNITLTSVTVEGPMEKMIGTERFEILAKKAYEDNLEYEKKLKKIKDIIEAEKPDSDRLYSAIHLVYGMRADVQDSRQKKFSEENALAVRIGEIEGNSKLSESDKAGRIQSEVNHFNLWKLSFEMDTRNSYDRFLKHMASLVGELSEATLDRLNSFEPQFGPLPFAL